jgi:iron complex outermembrane receptor protein
VNKQSSAGTLRAASGIASRRGRVACAVAAILACSATTAIAQTSLAADAPADTSAADSSSGAVQEVVVTGTRIISNGYSQPTPVTVATSEDLLKAAPTDLADALNAELPQFSNSSSPSRSSHNFASAPGVDNGNILNLRGVGGQRTLILFDGIRMPPTNSSGEVDVDVIPEMLIQKTDVVTGGASAVYGSDAVAGVVNFVLDRNFTGVKAEAQYGESQQSDNEQYRIGLAAGAKLFDGRGHVLFSAETYNNLGMLRSDRPSGRSDYVYVGSVPGSAAPPGSAANPFTIKGNISIPITSTTGLMLSGPLAGSQFSPGGTGVVPFNAGTATGTPGYNQNGDGLVIPANVTANAPLNTKKGYGRFTFDFSPELRSHIQGAYSRTTLDYILEANGFVLPDPATLFSGNPYLPSALQGAMNTSGMTSAEVGTYPFGPSPHTKEATDFLMVNAGLDGDLGDHWKWNADYTHGHTEYAVDQRDTLNWRNTFAAADVVNNGAGTPVCAASLSADPTIAARFANCQPLNILNPASTPAGLAYALGDSAYTSTTVQDTVDVSLQGDIWQLPAGPLGGAIGGEYRNERLDLVSDSDPAQLDTTAKQDAYYAGLNGVPAGLNTAYWLTNTGTAHGSVNVKEGFVELNAPILKDKPLVQSLNFTTAGRITDYSTSGTVKTWKLGSTYAPISDILFRGTLSADIRAPTVYDLFAGPQFAIGQLFDPVTNTTANLQTISSGNSKLQPEKGRTTTVGFVLSPSFLPGASASVDWYRLGISGAVGTIAAQTIVNDCFTSGGTSSECSFIQRATPTSFPTSVTLAPLNSQTLLTEGWDFDLSYRSNVGPGSLTTRLYANYLDRFVNPVLGSENSNLAGFAVNQTAAYPRIRSSLNVDYKIGPIDAFVAEQFIGPMNLNAPIQDNIHLNPDVPAVWYTNLTLDYATPLQGVDGHVFFTVNNLFDKQFPIIPGTIPGVNLPTALSLYDTVGRAFTLGVRVKF